MALATLVLLGGLTAPAFGQVKIEWKFKEGDKFYVEEVSNVKSSFQIMGNNIDQTQKTTTIASYTIKKSTDKEVVMEQKIESVKTKVEGGFGGEAGGLDKIMEKMEGAKFTITMDPSTGKVTKFEGYKELIKAITEGMEEAGKFVELLLTEDTLKKGSEDAFGFLPSKAVDKGDTWKIESTMPLGPFGNFKKNATYTYDGKDDKGEKIGYKLAMTYTAPKGDGAAGLPFKITKGNLKTDNAKGTILFDAEKGRLVSNTVTMRFGGSLTMDVMGNELTIEMTMDQSSTSRVLNRAPKKED